MHLDARLANSADGRVDVVTRDLESEVHAAEALSLRKGRVLFEQERASMQGDTLPRTLLSGPEPRPFLRRLVLQRQPDDILVEAG